jgi:hypothetical protein
VGYNGTVRAVRHRLVASLRRRRILYPLLLRARPGMHGRLTSRSTDLVVDGYLRSANSFAYHAFRGVNPDARVAHHLHSPLQISRAARYAVPAILLIREPGDAIASAIVQAPKLGGRTALREWIDFYRAVWPLRDHFVIGCFDEVTGDFAKVVQRINRSFGTSFATAEQSDDRDAEIFDTIELDLRAQLRPESDDEIESFIGRPSEHRTGRLEAVRSALRHEEPDELASARRLYEDFRAEWARQVEGDDS